MRSPFPGLLLLLLLTSPSTAVTIEWTLVGNPGNVADSTDQGSVAYDYQIGTYEVTNAQYAEFLNEKAQSDPLQLYNPMMGDEPLQGGIVRTGSSGGYAYVVIAGRDDMPVNWVSFWDAARFANWMNNGQGNADTETGAYTLLGGTADPSNGATVARNLGATIFLPSESEWYKAAYYDPSSLGYFDYPTGSDTETTCAAPTGAANSANCGDAVADLTSVGSYTGAGSPYGTFDQGGNVFEWNEVIGNELAPTRGVRGGAFNGDATYLAASAGYYVSPQNQDNFVGFRLAMIPEPDTGLLMIAGVLGLAGWRRASA
jgi:formylglycine-generating enzyme required for sulfatase activity